MDPSPDSEQRMVEAEAYSVFLALLNLLPDELREVLIMADLEEVSMPQIARELGISEDAGYARLRRARRRLQQGWQERQSASTPLLSLGGFTLDQMIARDRAPQPLDPELKARVWDRLEQDLGPEPGAGAARGIGPFGTVAVRVVGAGVIFGLGMVAGALLRGAPSEPAPVIPSTVVVADHSNVGAPLLAAATPTSEGAVSGPATARPSGSAPALVSSARLIAAAPRSGAGGARASDGASTAEAAMVAERAVIQEIRSALRNQDPTKALAALRRHRSEFKEPRFADVRDDLFRQAMDMREAQLHP